MRVWRLEQEKHKAKAFSGRGAAKYPGRWNPSGFAAVYCSESLALATLEVLVNVPPNILSKMKYVSLFADIPDEVAKKMTEFTLHDLKKVKGWNRTPAPIRLRAMAGKWFQDKSSTVLKVPSAIIPSESNFVLNPTHPDFGKIILGKPRPFIFDPRVLR